MKVLLVEDERKIAEFTAKGLREHGFVVDVAASGDDGLGMALISEYDLLILDVMLPGRDGWSVLSELRGRGVQVPALFLTARDGVSDRIKGLELGADDYLPKPFAFAELLARIRTILRRGPVRQPDVLTVGDLKLEPARMSAFRGETRLDLTPKEFALLHLLARRPGEILSRHYIAQQIWDMNFDGDSNVVDVHIRRLRIKVDDPFERRLIKTVRGVGYALDDAG
ncbi:DNA-binding response regulator in two-component regulatory system with CusS [Magnetospirillum sp. XM-1]|uniref:heavy metal response regulator transcription factor n=1 Tax=Magnetospirillum sp. XM-1 TaxID=1663591 RepID=UPI00073E05FE|nr:heavy metal response regulator transcription factor [Magnetospirillum sp. XM-1]CUW40591.1 DNA-binding response regulator in two-component regulatory system with CusS [Magnetospirillum sp. XM-1]